MAEPRSPDPRKRRLPRLEVVLPILVLGVVLPVTCTVTGLHVLGVLGEAPAPPVPEWHVGDPITVLLDGALGIEPDEAWRAAERVAVREDADGLTVLDLGWESEGAGALLFVDFSGEAPVVVRERGWYVDWPSLAEVEATVLVERVPGEGGERRCRYWIQGLIWAGPPWSMTRRPKWVLRQCVLVGE